MTDSVTYPFPGFKQVEGMRNGWKFWLQVFDPSKVRYKVVSTPSLARPSIVARNFKADVAWNGGEVYRGGMPKDYSVADGQVIVKRVEAVPSFIVRMNGSLLVSSQSFSDALQTISGLRYLIRNSTIDPALYGVDAKYTEGHSRSVEGLDARGFHLHFTGEGAYPNMGWKLSSVAEVMKEYGAVVAFDQGGGGDTINYTLGQILNVPEDMTNGIHYERAISQTLLVFRGEAMKYKVVWANGAAKRSQPTTYGLNLGTVPYPNTVDVLEDNIPDATYPTNTDMRWVRLTDGTFCASDYPAGTAPAKRMEKVVEPTPTPTTEPTVSFTLVVDGQTYEALDVPLKLK
jgi:hypothetical protein